MKSTSSRKPMTWKETLAFEKTLETINTLTYAQIDTAYALCAEFGDGFQGIRDRVNDLFFAKEHHERERETVQELLHSVNPVLAREIVEAGR